MANEFLFDLLSWKPTVVGGCAAGASNLTAGPLHLLSRQRAQSGFAAVKASLRSVVKLVIQDELIVTSICTTHLWAI